MAEPINGDSNGSSPDTDKDFDPSAEMLVHDYDDEHTLEEEENFSNSDGSNELEGLQKEGDMPIEELLAMYGYGGGGSIAVEQIEQESRSSSEEEILSNQDLTLDKDAVANDLLQYDEDSNKETSATDLLDSVDITSQTVRLLRSSDNAEGEDSDDSEDIDYDPVEDGDWRKSIQVGRDYQAVIPDGFHKYGDAPAYENEDRMLWDPFKLSDKEVEAFLREVQQQNLASKDNCTKSIPQGAHIRDDEQALYLLLQCGHNVDEALRRRKMQAVPPTDPMSLWSEEECRYFENGLKTYGKDFYMIQQNKVRTRSVGELVQFYYLWKKTERHDMFANKNRLEKKKYALHPGVTDYMDRFLDEQENQPPNKERPASPLNSLLYCDPKRHSSSSPHSPDVISKIASHEDIAAVVEVVQKAIDSNVLVVEPDFANKLNELAPELNAAVPRIPVLTSAGGDNPMNIVGSGLGDMGGSVLGGKTHHIHSQPTTQQISPGNMLSEVNRNTAKGGGDKHVLDETGEPQAKRFKVDTGGSHCVLLKENNSKKLEHSSSLSATSPNNCVLSSNSNINKQSNSSVTDSEQCRTGSKPLEDKHVESASLGTNRSSGMTAVATTTCSSNSSPPLRTLSIAGSGPKISLGNDTSVDKVMPLVAEAVAH